MLRYGKTKYLLERFNEMKGVMPDLKGLIFYLSDGGRL